MGADLQKQILKALGHIEDRIRGIDERLTRIEREVLDSQPVATHADIVMVRDSLNEVRGHVETLANTTLKKPPVAEPEPAGVNLTLEDF